MAAVAFDPLEYAQRLESAGMSRELAEVVARGLTAMFIHNFDALVTKDYLDTRFTEFETRLESRIDKRLTAMETSFDKRFAEFAAGVDKRFTESAASIDKRFAETLANTDKRFTQSSADIDERFADFRLEMLRQTGELQGVLKLHSWMLAVIVAVTLLPFLQRLGGFLG